MIGFFAGPIEDDEFYQLLQFFEAMPITQAGNVVLAHKIENVCVGFASAEFFYCVDGVRRPGPAQLDFVHCETGFILNRCAQHAHSILRVRRRQVFEW